MKCLYVINYNSVLAIVYQDVNTTLLDYFLCSRLSTVNDTFYVLITHLFRHAGGTLVSSQNDGDDREIEKTLFTEVKYNLLQPSLDPNFSVVQWALCRTWSRDLPTLKIKTWHLVNTRNEKSREQSVELPSLRSVADRKFGSSLNIGNGKKICMGKSCWMASLFISGIHKGPGLKFKGGRSRDQVLQSVR